jgi:hypothetical protein
MNANERAPLACGYASIIVALFGILGLFTIGATTLTVAVFVVGLAGVVGATAALVQAENGTQRPASRTG